MRQPVPPQACGATVVLLQPCDDGLEMYAEFLHYHQLAVIAVSDPWAALTAAPKADVIVTGILLAGSMDGVEFITRLRRDERTRRTPIIVLTACPWASEHERAECAGCDVFLSKPCVPDELLRHVHHVLATATLRRIRPTPIEARLRNEGFSTGTRSLG